MRWDIRDIYVRRNVVGLQYMYRVYVVHIKCSIFFAMYSKTYEKRKFRKKLFLLWLKNDHWGLGQDVTKCNK